MSESGQTITLAITGASGAIYGWDLLQKLDRAEAVGKIFLIVSTAGRDIVREELGIPLGRAGDLAAHHLQKAVWLEESDFHAPVASGSHPVDAMIIAPCSMATIGCLAAGAGRNLVHRAADVILKERRRLILLPRETPLHPIHLGNLLTLAQAGAIILPASPAFYTHPRTIAELVESLTYRVFQLLELPVPARYVWKGDV